MSELSMDPWRSERALLVAVWCAIVLATALTLAQLGWWHYVEPWGWPGLALLPLAAWSVWRDLRRPPGGGEDDPG